MIGLPLLVLAASTDFAGRYRFDLSNVSAKDASYLRVMQGNRAFRIRPNGEWSLYGVALSGTFKRKGNSLDLMTNSMLMQSMTPSKLMLDRVERRGNRLWLVRTDGRAAPLKRIPDLTFEKAFKTWSTAETDEEFFLATESWHFLTDNSHRFRFELEKKLHAEHLMTAVSAISLFGRGASDAQLRRVLTDLSVRRNIRRMLLYSLNRPGFESTVLNLKNDEAFFLTSRARYLARHGTKASLPFFRKHVASEDEYAFKAGVQGLARLGTAEDHARLRAMEIPWSSPERRVVLLYVQWKLSQNSATRRMIEADLMANFPAHAGPLASAFLEALSGSRDGKVLGFMLRLAQNPPPGMFAEGLQRTAIEYLGNSGDLAVLDVLNKLEREGTEGPSGRQALKEAIFKLTGKRV